MSRRALDELKRQIPLLDYLQAHDWRPARQLSRGRIMACVRCTKIISQACSSILSRTCSTVMVATAAVT